MDLTTFSQIVRTIVSKSIPNELEEFDLASEGIVPAVFKNGKTKQVETGGDAEFIDVAHVKTALEFVPLLYACHTILKTIAPAVRAKLRNRPSPQELEAELIKAGVKQPYASVAVAECRAELEKLVLG
jgi:hypothetical protein